MNVNKMKKQEMIDFLNSHFRYDTMGSWNGATSYAHNLKIYKVIPGELRSAALELMETEGFYDTINFLVSDFGVNHDQKWQAGFNGRSGGYLVLYQGGKHENGQVFCTPGKSLDMGEDFGEWSRDDLKGRCEIIFEFDQLAKDIIEGVIYMCKNMQVKEEEITIKKKIKVMAEK